MLPDPRPIGIRGFLIDSPSPGRLRGVRDGVLLIEEGCITASGTYESIRAVHAARDIRWMHSPEAVVVPGLIDVHAHLPQYPAVARHAGALLPWLKQHVFPLEKQFKAAAARTQAPAFYEDLARNGTTCAMLYSAIFEDSTEAAFSAAEESGMRIILGKMMMDVGSYGSLVPEKIVDRSCAESESLCRKWHGRDGGRLEYAFSPRFAVTCSEELMRRAGELAQKYDAYLQTHLSENREEIEVVKALFPARASYTDVYAHCGLLGPKTVLGHCIHLAEEEIAQLAAARAVVAHCPTSNFFLTSGLMPMNHLREAGLRIGLGSDVAGGPELNMWQVMRSAIETQKARHFHDDTVPILNVVDAFHLATQGGAEALGKETLVGAFEIGREADLAVLDLAAIMPYGRKLNPHANLTAEDVLALLVYRGGPTAVVETFVRGRSVYRAPPPNLV
jgi:guanine deaminase